MRGGVCVCQPRRYLQVCWNIMLECHWRECSVVGLRFLPERGQWIARVDPHFVRVPKVALQKTLLPRGFVVTHGKMKKTMRENVLMIAGGGSKKSFLLKRLKKLLTNSEHDPDFPGILEILKELGLCRKVPRKDCDMC